jgi:hypothetical protein
MDYHEFLLSLHLLAEERYGVRVRAKDYAEQAQLRESMKQQVTNGRTGRRDR